MRNTAAYVEAVAWWIAKAVPGLLMLAFLVNFLFVPYLRKA